MQKDAMILAEVVASPVRGIASTFRAAHQALASSRVSRASSLKLLVSALLGLLISSPCFCAATASPGLSVTDRRAPARRVLAKCPRT